MGLTLMDCTIIPGQRKVTFCLTDSQFASSSLCGWANSDGVMHSHPNPGFKVSEVWGWGGCWEQPVTKEECRFNGCVCVCVLIPSTYRGPKVSHTPTYQRLFQGRDDFQVEVWVKELGNVSKGPHKDRKASVHTPVFAASSERRGHSR